MPTSFSLPPSRWTSRRPAASGIPQAFFASLPIEEWKKSLKEDAARLEAAVRSLAQENNSEIFFASIYQLASTLEDRGHVAVASALFASLTRSDAGRFPIDASLRAKAERRLQAQTGTGASGDRFEFLGKRLFEDSASLPMLAGMTGASVVGGLAYGSLLARLSSGPASFWTKGLVAQGLAIAGSMAVEAPTFTALAKGSAALLGQGQAANVAFAEETLSTFLFLGSMKFAHRLGGAGSRWLASRASAGAASWSRAAIQVLPQVASFGGILGGNFLQKRAGLRPHLQDETLLADAAASLLHLNIGGHLAGKITGPEIQSWLTQVEQHARQAPRSEWRPVLMATVPEGPKRPASLWMSSQKPFGPDGGQSFRLPREIERQTEASVAIKVKKPPHLAENLKTLDLKQIEELSKTARNISSPLSRIEAIARLASQAAQHSSDQLAALSLFQESWKETEMLPSSLDRAVGFLRIGLEWAATGQTEHVQKSMFRGQFEAGMWRQRPSKDNAPRNPTETYSALVSLAAELKRKDFEQAGEDALILIHELQVRSFSPYSPDVVSKDVSIRLAELGGYEAARKMAAGIAEPEVQRETWLKIGKVLLEHGERPHALEILQTLALFPEGDELRAKWAIDLADTGEFEEFNYQARLISDPYHKIWAYFQASRISRQRGNTWAAIHHNLNGNRLLGIQGHRIDPAPRARLMAMHAGNLAAQNQFDECIAQIKIAVDLFTYFLGPRPSLLPEILKTKAEIVRIMLEAYPEKEVEPWLQMWTDQVQAEVLKRVVVQLAREDWIDPALLWASKVPSSYLDEVRKELAWQLFRSGYAPQAQNLAREIEEPEWRFKLLFELSRYLNSQDSVPPGSNPPPSSESGPSSGTPPNWGRLPRFSLAPSDAIPAINVWSAEYGRTVDQKNPRKSKVSNMSRVLAELAQEVPGYLMDTKKPPPSSGWTPVSMHLPLEAPGLGFRENFRFPSRDEGISMQLSGPSDPGNLPGDERLSSTTTSDLVGQPSSDRPPEHGSFRPEAEKWAFPQGFGAEDANYAEGLLKNIYEEMWRVLNFHSSSRVAHRIATGEPITVRLIATAPKLGNYRVQLLEDPAAPQTDFNWVQLQLNPATGALRPLEFAAHAAAEAKARAAQQDFRRYFIPFYRRISLVSPGLQSEKLLPRLNPILKNLVLADPTILKARNKTGEGVSPPAAAPQEKAVGPSEPPPSQGGQVPSQPTLLVVYRPLISVGVKHMVDQYCDGLNLPPEGRRRLQRLTQLILGTLFERERQIDLPKNAKLRKSPYLQVFVGPTRDGPERQVEIFTFQEANLRDPRPEEIVLTLNRFPAQVGEFDTKYSYLQHSYIQQDGRGNPEGADWLFQSRLGLPLVNEHGNPQFMHLPLGPYFHLKPGDLLNWDKWMLENGYFQEQNKNTIPK